jgi:PAS domain S-box-containing protein
LQEAVILRERAGVEIPLRRTAAARAWRWSPPAQVLLFGLTYLAIADLGHWLLIGSTQFATFWPSAGLYIGVLLRVEPRRWPFFAAAAALPGAVSHVLLYGHPPLVSLGFAAANTLEAVVAAGLLRRFWFRDRPAAFATLGDVLALSIVAGLAVPLIGTAADAAVAARGFGVRFSETWAVLWSIHAVGILLVAPIVLVCPSLDGLRSLWRAAPLSRWLEAAAMLATVAAYSLVLFGVSPSGLSDGALAFPVLLWPALRLGPRGVAAAVAVMALISTRGTALGHGPFADPAYDVAAVQVLLLQAFLGVAAVSAHVLAAATDEKRKALARLAAFNTELEARVATRTAELADANAALRHSEDRARRGLDELRLIYDTAPVGLCVLDRELRYVRINERLAQDHGIPAAAHLGRTVREILPHLADAIEPVYRRILATGEPSVGIELEGEMEGRPGARRAWVASRLPLRDKAGRVVGVSTVVEDVTERKSTEATLRRLNETLEHRIADAVAEREAALRQLAQAQKMEAVGQLTGGVAHDFNNLLTAVLGNLDLLERRIAGDEATRKLLDGARLAAERGATLTSQLLAFSRKQHLRPKTTDVSALVTGLGDLLLHTIGGTVRVRRSLAPAPWPVLVDPSQIELAVLNLSINARDAMPAGGTLTIETANVPAGHAEAPKTLTPGDYVMISVADTGTGMSDEVLAKVFEPFFTTKEVGKGSGLGLSMVLGIAQQHGGGVEIASRIGRGTTVRLYLPRAAAAEAKRPAEAETAATAPGETRAGCLLVVDDDPDVRAFTVECLRGLGHRVIGAENGRAALDVVEADDTVELALVDLAMPGMSGPKFAATARLRRPSLRVLFMTGYADMSLLPDAPDAAVIKKPFRVSELAATVAEALGRDDAARPGTVAATTGR